MKYTLILTIFIFLPYNILESIDEEYIIKISKEALYSNGNDFRNKYKSTEAIAVLSFLGTEKSFKLIHDYYFDRIIEDIYNKGVLISIVGKSNNLNAKKFLLDLYKIEKELRTKSDILQALFIYDLRNELDFFKNEIYIATDSSISSPLSKIINKYEDEEYPIFPKSKEFKHYYSYMYHSKSKNKNISDEDKIKYLKKAYEIEPVNEDILNDLGEFHIKDDLNLSIEYFNSALKYFPNSSTTLFNLYKVNKIKNNENLAQDYYQQSIKNCKSEKCRIDINIKYTIIESYSK